MRSLNKNKEILRFLNRFGFFLMVIILPTTLLLFFGDDPLETDEYLAAMTDKHQRIDSIKESKLILAGGSNLVFGIDSQIIEQQLKIPVVNLGLQASLGLNFILNELEDVAKKGDIIVLSIEHSVTAKGNKELQKMTSYYNPFARKYYNKEHDQRFKKVIVFIESQHIVFKKTISKYIEKLKNDPVYTRNALNKYGDGIYHLDLPSQSVLGSRSILNSNRDTEITLLNQFNNKMKKRGVSVLFSYGAYEIEEFEKNKKTLHKIHQDFKNKLEIEMITNLEDFVYPTSYFYDSVYHLNKTGREIHTKNVIFRLQNSIIITHNSNIDY